MTETDNLHNVYLALGSNIGDTKKNLLHAIENIKNQIGKLISLSDFYATKPVGFESKNMFVNAACQIQTTLRPLEILNETQKIEKNMGRNSKSSNGAYSDRIIDIDILMYDEQTITSSELTLPHPHLHERGFVLHPLSDIAGDVLHPLLGKSINQLKAEFDNLENC